MSNPNNEIVSVTFRTPIEKRAALDALAESMDRDRSYVLNEAIRAYLDLYEWQANQIRQGLAAAEAGDFASDEEVATAFAEWDEG